MKTEFICSKCNEHKVYLSDITTGYATDKDGNKICFDCCGKEDEKTLIETGKLSGYFVRKANGWYFTNWPSSFELYSYYQKKSRHNFAGKDGRTDFWVTYKGNNYHGVQIGHNNQCATIRKVK